MTISRRETCLTYAVPFHVEPSVASSPRSAISRIDRTHSREKAEQVLEALISMLSTPTSLTKFASALPLTRICLLLLGEHPAPCVTTQVLLLIGLALRASSSFNRKFELVSGWTVLRQALPGSWAPNVHAAAFDVLLGRMGDSDKKAHEERIPTVSCPYIVPAIFASLHHSLLALSLVEPSHLGDTTISNGELNPQLSNYLY